MATKRDTARRKATKAGDLSVRADKASRAKGGIIIVNTRSTAINLASQPATKGIAWGGPTMGG